jgi:hypothetical protein
MMMSPKNEASLEALFDEARQELEGEAITAQVMAGTRNRLLRMAAMALSAAIVVLLVGWYLFAGPLLEFAVLLSQFLTNPLVDLGEGWLGLVFLPINNLASVLVLSTKLSLLAWKKLTGSALIR